MDHAIFDRDGAVVGWLHNGTDIFDLHNRDRGFVRDGHVFDTRSRYLGEFNDGYFWDRRGDAVAFVQGAAGGPVPPVPRVPPVPPIHAITPIRSIPPIPPIPPVHSFSWSQQTFELLLID